MTKERKYILIGGVILLFLGLIYRFYPDIQELFSSNEAITLKKRKLASYRELVQERNALEEKLITINRTLERAESALLTGETSALAAVDLQNILNDITSKNKVEIKTMQVLNPEKPDGKTYIGIPIQIAITTNIRQLKEVLLRIETSSKLIIITELKIKLPISQQFDQIYTTITIQGYMKYGEKSGKPA